MKSISFDLGPFPCNVYIYLCTPEAFLKRMRRKFKARAPEPLPEDVNGMAFVFPPNHFVMWLHPDNKPPTLVSNLAHEAAHTVDYIFDHLQIDTGPGSMEPRAYLTGYIVSKGLSLLDINPQYP